MSLRIVSAVLVATFLVNAHHSSAAVLAARVGVTGTTNAGTVAAVKVQTVGPTLFVATDPANLGDLSLLTGASTVVAGGVPFAQSSGVIIAAPNMFQYASVSNRNIIETPGELSSTIPSGFPTGMWLSTTNVAGAGAENNFDLGLAHFPFADGWKAGHVMGTDGTFLAGNTSGVTITTQFGIPDISFNFGHYKLSISGVNARTDGMLFAQGEVNSSSGNVVPVGILPDESGWDVRINDQGGNFPNTEQANWSFVYVPYDAQNLVAGGNLGIDDATSVFVRQSVGTFTAARVDLGDNTTSIAPPGAPDGLADSGRFLITIPGATDMTGYLMVGVSKNATAGGFSGADDNFLTWEYNATLGGFWWKPTTCPAPISRIRTSILRSSATTTPSQSQSRKPST